MKRGTVLTAVMLGLTALASHAGAAVLYTTNQDWTEWNGSGNISKAAQSSPDLDNNLTNGLGNNTNAGGSGTAGSLMATWSSGTFEYFFGDGDQNNAGFRTALGTSASGNYTAATGTLLFDYTKPPPGSGNYFQLGIVLNYDSNFGQFFGTETDNGNGTFTATVPYTINATGSASYFQIGFIYNSNYNTNTPFTIDNLRTPAVPEPASAGLMAIGGVVATVRRRRC
jgi:hypothetical protein